MIYGARINCAKIFRNIELQSEHVHNWMVIPSHDIFEGIEFSPEMNTYIKNIYLCFGDYKILLKIKNDGAKYYVMLDDFYIPRVEYTCIEICIETIKMPCEVVQFCGNAIVGNCPSMHYFGMIPGDRFVGVEEMTFVRPPKNIGIVVKFNNKYNVEFGDTRIIIAFGMLYLDEMEFFPKLR